MKRIIFIALALVFFLYGSAVAGFLQASGSTTQQISTVPEAAIIDQIDEIYGFHVVDDSKAVCRIAGYYLIVSAPQFGTVCGNKTGYATNWLRINGNDVANSNVLKDLHPTKTKDVIISQSIVLLYPGDYVEFMVAGSNDSGCQALEAIQPDGQPLVPSIIVSIAKIY